MENEQKEYWIPIEEFAIKAKCPSCGEKGLVVYDFCPWCGKRLYYPRLSIGYEEVDVE